MGIVITQDDDMLVVVNTTGGAIEAAQTNTDLVVIGETIDPVVVEVLAGQKGDPGLQNVRVQTTAPSNPFEGLVWIDIS